MTSKTHQTALVLIPPQGLWEPIQKIRQQHDRQVRRWMPHVTLLYPFRPRRQFDAAEAGLRGAAQKIDPFEICLRRFQHFHHGRDRYTLWLAPEPEEKVKELQAALESALPDLNDVSGYSRGFTPHVSVGQVRGKETMAILKADLQASWQPISFRVDHVCLIWRDPPPMDIFRVDREVNLGHQPET